MISFKWLEFETLSREIADLEEQFNVAKAPKNQGHMRGLEPQLDAARKRRAQVPEAITRRAASAAGKPALKSGRAEGTSGMGY